MKTEVLNDYFCSVFTDESLHPDVPHFGLFHDISPLSDISITTDIILNKLTDLNPSKSPGPDGWPPIVLKEIAQQICLPLYIIFSKSLATGCIPDDWKKGLVVPIYKKVLCNI